MAKAKKVFVCRECGHHSAKWLGSCPSCGKWNTFREDVKSDDGEEKQQQHKSRIKDSNKKVRPKKLSEIDFKEEQRLPTKIKELDRVLGGGFMPGSFVLLGGDPGVGKSTLTLQIARANPSIDILYCAGEESAGQIKQRATRMHIDHETLLIYNETNVSKIVREARETKPDLLIVDSIQTLYRPESQSMPGSVRQIRECSALLQQLAKQYGITTLIVGHVTKEGELAGPRLLEHTVDTVLQFEGQDMHTYRLLRSLKNRFGPAHEVGVFDMRDDGLKEINNPSEFFISNHPNKQSGSAIICTIEGSRPLLVEIQALVTNSNYGTPQRTSNGFDNKRLSLLLAVLEKRAGYHFSGQDVYLNVAGGLKIMDPASDLGVALALVSSLVDKPINHEQVFLGEVGLGGEVRAVSHLERRLGEVGKLGYNEVLLPRANKSNNDKSGLDLIHINELDEVWDLCL